MVEAADEEGDEFPRLRAGIAHGSVHVQAGDYYGRPVNLASRLTAIAKPGSVLLDAAAKEAAGEGFDYSYAGEKRLKGFDSRTKLYRARRRRTSRDGLGGGTSSPDAGLVWARARGRARRPRLGRPRLLFVGRRRPAGGSARLALAADRHGPRLRRRGADQRDQLRAVRRTAIARGRSRLAGRARLGVGALIYFRLDRLIAARFARPARSGRAPGQGRGDGARSGHLPRRHPRAAGAGDRAGGRRTGRASASSSRSSSPTSPEAIGSASETRRRRNRGGMSLVRLWLVVATICAVASVAGYGLADAVSDELRAASTASPPAPSW